MSNLPIGKSWGIRDLVNAVNELFAGAPVPVVVQEVSTGTASYSVPSEPQKLIVVASYDGAVDYDATLFDTAPVGSEIVFKDTLGANRNSTKRIRISVDPAVDGETQMDIDVPQGSFSLVRHSAGVISLGRYEHKGEWLDAISFFDRVISENTTILASENALSVGPVDIEPGVTVTVEPGARWAIV